MKILVLTSRVPALDKKGDQVIAFHRLTYLAKKGHSIKVISFGDMDNAEDCLAREILETYGIVVCFIPWNRWEATMNIFFAAICRNTPFQCALYKSSEFSAAFKEHIALFNPDVVYCILVRVAENLKRYKGKLFVEIIDSMGLNFNRRASMSKSIKKWMLNIEGRRISSYERYLADKSVRSFVVSTIDQKAIGSGKVDAIPLGVDLQKLDGFRYCGDRPIIIFTGNMNYQPNVDAICWFVSHCWTFIKQAMPGVQLVIAGNNPRASIVSLGDSDGSVKVTGRIAFMPSILKTASLAIAPMQSGSGMQFKILEAMASGIPVVVTSLGLGDIRAKHGEELLVADTSSEFVISILKLLNSLDLQAKIGRAGFNFVKENHAWDVLNAQFERIILAD